jgi:hypothetical protein
MVAISATCSLCLRAVLVSSLQLITQNALNPHHPKQRRKRKIGNYSLPRRRLATLAVMLPANCTAQLRSLQCCTPPAESLDYCIKDIAHRVMVCMHVSRTRSARQCCPALPAALHTAAEPWRFKPIESCYMMLHPSCIARPMTSRQEVPPMRSSTHAHRSLAFVIISGCMRTHLSAPHSFTSSLCV